MVRSAATVSAVTVLPVKAYTPAVINKSCINAINTGTANFHSNRNAMYNEITINDAMIAATALFATDLPNDGPTEFALNRGAPLAVATPNLFWSAVSTAALPWNLFVSIWKPYLPSAES